MLHRTSKDRETKNRKHWETVWGQNWKHRAESCATRTPKNLFGGKGYLLQRIPEDKHVTLPQDLYYGWRRMARTKSTSIERMKHVNSKNEFKEKWNNIETTKKQQRTAEQTWTNHKAIKLQSSMVFLLFSCAGTLWRLRGECSACKGARHRSLGRPVVSVVWCDCVSCDWKLKVIVMESNCSTHFQIWTWNMKWWSNHDLEVEIERSLQKLPRQWR